VTPQTFGGLEKFLASKVVGTPDGSPAPFYRIAERHSPSIGSLQTAAASASAQKAVAHVVVYLHRRDADLPGRRGSHEDLLTEGCTESLPMPRPTESALAHRALGFQEVGLVRCFRKDL